jgi:hypothetical protein
VIDEELVVAKPRLKDDSVSVVEYIPTPTLEPTRKTNTWISRHLCILIFIVQI